MSYQAKAVGTITMNQILDVKKAESIRTILEELYEIIPFIENGCTAFDVYRNDSYDDMCVDEVLKRTTKVSNGSLAEGYIAYLGEDGTNFCWVYADGRWMEKNARIVYDDTDVFFTLEWKRDDIIAAYLEEYGKEPSQEMIDAIAASCQKDHNFDEGMREAGWDALKAKVRKLSKKGGQSHEVK